MSFRSSALCFATALFAIPLFAHADTTTTTTTDSTNRSTYTQGGHWAGVEIGPNFSSFTNEGSGSGKTEFVIGGFVDWQMRDIWYLSTGLRYNSYGISAASGGTTNSFTAHFIEIPVLLKPTFDAGGWFPYALIGPSFGFKTGESVDSTNGGNSVSSSTSAIKTFDISMDFGVGAEVPVMANLRAFAQFEYALGLNNIANSSNGASTKSRGAMLLFGVMAPF